MIKKAVGTSSAPAAIGPYSQAVVIDRTVYVSGQLPVSPDTGSIVPGTIEQQTEKALENLSAVLDAAGSSLEHVVKTSVFIRDMKLFQKMNSVYSRYLCEPYPARSCIEVSALPKDAMIEIDAVAYIP